ncbi:methyltransferase domain-containing protein, partial [Alphaproteobacteria bacterium]|nr:methyltransferase domain-containing protein [Alphaproteobacteria bacterium]
NIEAEEIKKINYLTNVTDDVSMLVKRQYEENPYPVWEVTYLYESKYSIYDYFVKNNLKTDKINMLNSENNDVLIAGSGTGQHAIQSSSRFKNSNVLAIDLSSRSTAYAIRKANELGVNNIKFMIADILDLKKLNKSFTIIESCGVLHHLENPLDGWSELVKKLKPNGLMRIGLYSKLNANNQLGEYNTDLTGIDEKVETLTLRYKAQFGAMESAVTSLKSTGEYLTNMMDSWNKEN